MTCPVNYDTDQQTVNLKNLYGQLTAIGMISEILPLKTTFDLPPSQNCLDILVRINESLNGKTQSDQCVRAINFMIYELNSQCSGAEPLQRLEKLNQLFFQTKNFRLDNEPLDLQNVLVTRSGSAICLALIYIHIGQSLGLKLQLVHWPLHAVIRLSTDTKCFYLDLENKGTILSEEELLKLVHQHGENVKTLNLREAELQYLSYAIVGLRQKNDLSSALKLMDLILTIEPENMRCLAERALLKKDLGLLKEALLDFKRYFSFVDINSASHDVITSFRAVKESTT